MLAGLAGPVEEHLAEYAAAPDAAWGLLAQRIEEAGPDASVRIVPGEAGRMRLSVEKLEALGEPPSLVALRKTVAAMLPRVDLPELLMEVHSWTSGTRRIQDRGPWGTSGCAESGATWPRCGTMNT